MKSPRRHSVCSRWLILCFKQNWITFSVKGSPQHGQCTFWFCAFFTFYNFSVLAACTVRYWNTTYRRNSMNQRSNKEWFDLVPDPDGFLGGGDRVDPRLGSRVGTRTKAESVSGFLQALFAVTRLRWMKGHATAAFGLWMKEEIMLNPERFKTWKHADFKQAKINN